MIVVKPGVRLTHQVPAMAWACFRLHEVFAAHGVDVLVITSGDDGDHGQRGVSDESDPKTLHGKGKAHDFRTHVVPRARLDEIVSESQTRLGRDYDVLLEGRGTPNEHLHVEWQPFGGI